MTPLPSFSEFETALSHLVASINDEDVTASEIARHVGDRLLDLVDQLDDESDPPVPLADILALDRIARRQVRVRSKSELRASVTDFGDIVRRSLEQLQ